MKRIKKYLIIILILIYTIGISSCGIIDNSTEGGITVNPPIQVVSFRVYFVVDGETTNYMDVTNMQIITPPKIPSKKNFEVVGWVDEKGKLVDFKSTFSSSQTFYAKYNADYSEIHNELIYSIISANVKVHKTAYNTGFLGIGKKDVISGQGSGIIFHDQHNNYYVLTNEHVTTKTNRSHVDFEIIDYKGNTYNAYLQSNSEQADYDLAVLYFKKGPEKLHVIERASKNPPSGEEVIAVGQPKGQMNASTFGEVTKYASASLTSGFKPDFDVIYHDAYVNNGSSGGALLDFDFNLVGINFGGWRDSTINNAVTVSVPIETVEKYLRTYVFN